MRLGDTVTRLRGTDTSGPHGEPVTDWTTPNAVPYAAEVYAPQSDEDVALAQRVAAQYVVQAFPEADFLPTDRAVWQGDTYEIVSAIDKLAMRGEVRSLKFLIKRWTGA